MPIHMGAEKDEPSECIAYIFIMLDRMMKQSLVE